MLKKRWLHPRMRSLLLAGSHSLYPDTCPTVPSFFPGCGILAYCISRSHTAPLSGSFRWCGKFSECDSLTAVAIPPSHLSSSGNLDKHGRGSQVGKRYGVVLSEKSTTLTVTSGLLPVIMVPGISSQARCLSISHSHLLRAMWRLC